MLALHSFIIYCVKMTFLLFVLNILRNTPLSSALEKSKEMNKSRKLPIPVTSHHRTAVGKAFSLFQIHKVSVLYHCLVEVHYRGCWLRAALVWQSMTYLLINKWKWNRYACDDCHLSTTETWIIQWILYHKLLYHGFPVHIREMWAVLL